MAKKFRDLVEETRREDEGNAVAGAAVALMVMAVVYGLILYVYSVA